MPIVTKSTYDILVDFNRDGKFDHPRSNIGVYYSDWDVTHGLDLVSDRARLRFVPARGRVLVENTHHLFSADIDSPLPDQPSQEDLRRPLPVKIVSKVTGQPDVELFRGLVEPPVVAHRLGFSTATFETISVGEARLQETLDFDDEAVTLEQLFERSAMIYNEGQSDTPTNIFDDVATGAMVFRGTVGSYVDELMKFGNGYAYETHTGALGFISAFALRAVDDTNDIDMNVSEFLIDAEGTFTELLAEIVRNEATIRVQEAEAAPEQDAKPAVEIGTLESVDVPAGTSISRTVLVRTPPAGQTWRWILKTPSLVRSQVSDASILGLLSIGYGSTSARTNVEVVITNSSFNDVTVSNIVIEGFEQDYTTDEVVPIVNGNSVTVHGPRPVSLPEWYGLQGRDHATATITHISDPLLGARIRLPMWQRTPEKTQELAQIRIGDVLNVDLVDSNRVQVSARMVVLQIRMAHNYKRYPIKELLCVSVESIGIGGASRWGVDAWGTAKWG